MSKIFTFLFALVVLGFSLLIYSFRSSENRNFINNNIRPSFLKSTLTRKVFVLNKVGDMRYEYALSGKPKVLVEVDWQKGREPDKDVNLWVENLISETAGKDAEVKISADEDMQNSDNFSDKQLREIAKVTQDYSGDGERSYLHILYVSRSSETPTNSGLVLTDDDIFIFKDAIDDLTDREVIRARIEESTIKHEFGHLLGLEHVARENCVMSESVEVYGNRKRQFESTPLDFCEESIGEITKLGNE